MHDHAIDYYWAQLYPDRPQPPRREDHHAGEHLVTLLGDDQGWDVMLRWSSAPDREQDAARLAYFLGHQPPVTLPRPLGSFEASFPPPYDRCDAFTPVNGEPLYAYLERDASIDVQESLGTAIGSFIAWLNSVPCNVDVVPQIDKRGQDIRARRDECIKRVVRNGVSEPQAIRLVDRLVAMWDGLPSRAMAHMDLYPQHMLVAPDLTIGVIDWDDAAPSDPITDFTMWYEPFDGRLVFRDAYPEAYRAACRAYRIDFPTPAEDERLKLHALAGVLSYDTDDDPDARHVKDWLACYGADVGIPSR